MKNIFPLMLILLTLKCATTRERNYVTATATATSREMQMSVNKAKHDAMLNAAQQIESHIQGLMKKFDEEIGRAPDSEILKQYSRVSKNVVDLTLNETRVKNREIVEEGEIFRARVTVEVPLKAARMKFLNQIRRSDLLYNRYKNTRSYRNLEMEYDEFIENEREELKDIEEREDEDYLRDL